MILLESWSKEVQLTSKFELFPFVKLCQIIHNNNNKKFKRKFNSKVIFF